MARRAPKSEHKFMTLCRWLVRKWAMVAPGQIGLTGEQVDGFTDLHDQAARAISDVRAAEVALREALDRKHLAVAALRTRFGGLSGIIDGFAATEGDKDVYALAGLKAHTKPRRRAGAPAAPTAVSARVIGGGAVAVSIDAKSDGRVIEIQRAPIELVESAAPHVTTPRTATGPWATIEQAGRRKLVDRAVPLGLAGVLYRARVVTTTGERSAWSQPGVVNFGSDQAGPASSEQTQERAA